VETRISLLKQPLGLHDPRGSFVLTAEAGDCPELASYRRQPSRCGDEWNVAIAILVSKQRRCCVATRLIRL
jgi:hypothetical protein